MARLCQPHAIVSRNLFFTYWRHNFWLSQPKSFILSHWKAQSFNLIKYHIFFNKVQNIRQNNFETTKGFIFDCALQDLVRSYFNKNMDKTFFQILIRSYKVLQNLVKSYFNENMGKIFSDFINTLQRSCKILF